MSLTRETIEQLAPDQSSLSAAKKLLAPKKWPRTAASADGALLWGECQGSGSTPYRVVYAPSDRGYKCTCPSRKFPCKHVLALMWLHVDAAVAFEPDEVPEWIHDWMSRRRKGDPATGSAGTPGQAPRAARSLADAEAEPAAPSTGPTDPARAAAQRERNRARREQQILAGLDELDAWLSDQLERGLASFAGVAAEQSRLISRRLADAKAPGVASRIDETAAGLFAVPDTERGAYLAEHFGALHLLAQAYRNQQLLPAALRADVRALVGWTTERQDVLDDPDTRRVVGTWIVTARVDVVQPDRLRRVETWLLHEHEARAEPAVLIDFVPVAGGRPDVPYTVGERLRATLAFYPSNAPLRAVLASRDDERPAAPTWPAQGLADALDRRDEARAAQPWLERTALVADDARIVLASSGELWLVDARTSVGMPLHREQHALALPLVGMAPFRAFAIADAHCATLHYARTEIGDWRCP